MVRIFLGTKDRITETFDLHIAIKNLLTGLQIKVSGLAIIKKRLMKFCKK